MKNSDPGMRIIFLQKMILISTPFFPCKQQVAISNTGPILVFPWIHPLGCELLRLLAECIHDKPLHEIVKIAAMSSVMRYCPISTTFRNPGSIQKLSNLSCHDDFSIRSPFFCKRRSWLPWSSQSKSTSLLVTLGTNEELDCHSTTGCPFYREKFRTLHTFLRLLRKDWPDLQK